MKILLAHNYYQQPGGEDQVFHSERQLLNSYGHEVIQYDVHNDQLDDLTNFQLARMTLWNKKTSKNLQRILQKERPHLVHFHNIFPLISPSAYYAVKTQGIPVIQTLHNYRIFCAQGMAFRDGNPCESCLNKPFAWPGIIHACYRGSRLATSGIVSRNFLHHYLSTWHSQVDTYIALTEFSRQKFIQGGLPSRKIIVKPNFVDSKQKIGKGEGNYALFVGRLVQEKGIDTLLQAWNNMDNQVPLKIVGDGPLFEIVKEYSGKNSMVETLGKKDKKTVHSLMQNAAFLIFPSHSYENLPMVIPEAYAAGLPIIGSRLGNMTSLIKHQVTGLHFQHNDASDLVKQVEWALHNPKEMNQMRISARKEFEERYTPEKNYSLLMKIYERAISEHGGKLA